MQEINEYIPIKNKVYHTISNSLILPASKTIKLTSNIDNRMIITVDGRNKVYEHVSEVTTSIKNHINVFRKADYNYIKKINDKFIK